MLCRRKLRAKTKDGTDCTDKERIRTDRALSLTRSDPFFISFIRAVFCFGVERLGWVPMIVARKGLNLVADPTSSGSFDCVHRKCAMNFAQDDKLVVGWVRCELRLGRSGVEFWDGLEEQTHSRDS